MKRIKTQKLIEYASKHGLNAPEIARLLGADRTTVHRYLDPKESREMLELQFDELVRKIEGK